MNRLTLRTNYSYDPTNKEDVHRYGWAVNPLKEKIRQIEEFSKLCEPDKQSKKQKVIKELEEVINRNSLENESNTPDFVLAEYLYNCLQAFNQAIKQK